MHEESFRLQEMVVYRIVGGGMTMKTTMVDEESVVSSDHRFLPARAGGPIVAVMTS